MSKKSDKQFANFVLEGISYNKKNDFFILNPQWLIIILEQAEYKGDIYKLAKEKGFE